MAFTQHLPTLALVALGAGELAVGLQNAFVFAFIGLQLPTLRAVARLSKRRILLAGQLLAVVAALPLLFFRDLAAIGEDAAVAVAMGSFAGVAAGLCIAETVWFPLLRAYVEPRRIGRFFGMLRTGWHLSLIGFFAFSQYWLARHPGDFAPLFALAWALGVARIALVARLPERSERTGERIRVREALALAREPQLRRYLLAVSWGNGVRNAALPFVIVMLRRAAGFDEGQVLYTTVALFTGGLVSLYPWGRVVDRAGAVPVLRGTSVGLAVLMLLLVGVEADSSPPVAAMVLWFFATSVLASGYGVADTHLLFELTPEHAPARTLVLGAVTVGLVSGVSPLLAGACLQVLLPEEGDALRVYHGFFAALALLQALAFLPLRGLRT